MLTLSACSAKELEAALRSGRFRLFLGSISLKVSSLIPEFVAAFREVYSFHPVSLNGGEYDFDIAVSPPSLWRRWFRRNAIFEYCGHAPFLPMDVEHAHALFEWGLNWTLATHLNNYLILHSAVVEWEEKGVLLAAVSGSGKSTLSAELSLQGWRLLSDELALIDGDINVISLARPISLKNSSIDIIRSRHPGAIFAPLARETHKGTVGHVMAPQAAVDQNLIPTIPKLIVFPKWAPDSNLRVQSVGAGQAAIRLIDQAFNYSMLGATGFERLVALVQSAEAWEIEYSSLDEAREALEELVRERG